MVNQMQLNVKKISKMRIPPLGKGMLSEMKRVDGGMN